MDVNSRFLRAARAGNLHEVKSLLGCGADINSVINSDGVTALFLASREGHSLIVQELLDWGADVDPKTRKDNTPLHTASLAGHCQVVQILIDNKAEINFQSEEGRTALYLASKHNHASVVSLLLKHGADQYLTTVDGYTPLRVARVKNLHRISQLLMENQNLVMDSKADEKQSTFLLSHRMKGSKEMAGIRWDVAKLIKRVKHVFVLQYELDGAKAIAFVHQWTDPIQLQLNFPVYVVGRYKESRLSSIQYHALDLIPVWSVPDRPVSALVTSPGRLKDMSNNSTIQFKGDDENTGVYMVAKVVEADIDDVKYRLAITLNKIELVEEENEPDAFSDNQYGKTKNQMTCKLFTPDDLQSPPQLRESPPPLRELYGWEEPAYFECDFNSGVAPTSSNQNPVFPLRRPYTRFGPRNNFRNPRAPDFRLGYSSKTNQIAGFGRPREYVSTRDYVSRRGSVHHISGLSSAPEYCGYEHSSTRGDHNHPLPFAMPRNGTNFLRCRGTSTYHKRSYMIH